VHALSFKTKVHRTFGGGKTLKNGHPFAAIGGYDNWISTGLTWRFRDQLEDGVKALEASLFQKMGVHLVHKHKCTPHFSYLVDLCGAAYVEAPLHDGRTILAL
jgi:hypothetical protein